MDAFLHKYTAALFEDYIYQCQIKQNNWIMRFISKYSQTFVDKLIC